MQRQLLYSCFTLLLIQALGSCNPCGYLDCISSNFDGQFRIISKTDGKGLVFGPTTVYDKTNLKFYSLNVTDTTFFPYTTVYFPGSGYDSILLVQFYPETTTDVYMKLNDTDTDTLTITYTSFKTKCCGTITEISKFRYNNILDLPGSQGTQEIRK